MREEQEKAEAMTGAMLTGIPEVDLGVEYVLLFLCSLFLCAFLLGD